MTEVLVSIGASRPRLVVGVGMQVVLGALLVWVAMAHPPETLGWRLFLLAAGGVALWSAYASWLAGQRKITLTREALTDSSGAVLCRIEEIREVARGVFAFKPARGFSLVLKRPQKGGWAPGLWWRIGRRVGVGGMTGAAETRLMAEILEALLAERAARG